MWRPTKPFLAARREVNEAACFSAEERKRFSGLAAGDIVPVSVWSKHFASALITGRFPLKDPKSFRINPHWNGLAVAGRLWPQCFAGEA